MINELGIWSLWNGHHVFLKTYEKMLFWFVAYWCFSLWSCWVCCVPGAWTLRQSDNSLLHASLCLHWHHRLQVKGACSNHEHWQKRIREVDIVGGFELLYVVILVFDFLPDYLNNVDFYSLILTIHIYRTGYCIMQEFQETIFSQFLTNSQTNYICVLSISHICHICSV